MSFMRAALSVTLLYCFAGAASASEGSTSGFKKVEEETEFVSLVGDRSLSIRLYGIDLKVSPDGKITGRGAGRPVSGDWDWRSGYFCRDLFWGKRDLGPNCQLVQVRGSTMRFTSDRGEGRSADFRLR